MDWNKLFKGAGDLLSGLADTMAKDGLKSNDSALVNNSRDLIERLDSSFYKWLNRAFLEELRQGLSARKYQIRSDCDNDWRRENDLIVRIRELERR